jgi:hypothetical protein
MPRHHNVQGKRSKPRIFNAQGMPVEPMGPKGRDFLGEFGPNKTFIPTFEGRPGTMQYDRSQAGDDPSLAKVRKGKR